MLLKTYVDGMVNLESIEKRQKTMDGIDRISTLPDSVLCHILSFLPTKTCVETSILSRRWCHVWKEIQVFDFCDAPRDISDNEIDLFKRFSVFVNGVLDLRRSRDIQKMRLSCRFSSDDLLYAISISAWVRAAIGPKLKELCLTLYSIDEYDFVIPSTLFTCTNLVSLSLTGGIHVKLKSTSKVCLPSLKMLLMDVFEVDSLDVLLSGCPILETLEISFAPKFVSKICLPHSLKSLKFSVDDFIGTHLEIDAPDLECLSITQCFKCAPLSVGNLANVVDAYLDVYSDEEPVNTLLNLLRAISGARYLEITRATTKWLLRAPVLDFPEFRNLVTLDIFLPYFNSNFIFNVLSKCHAVQNVVIKNENKPSIHRKWEKPTAVPHCVVSSLCLVHIKGFHGFQNELFFVTYLLRYGLLLKLVNVEIDNHIDIQWKNKIINVLCAIPRASNMCELKFE